MVCDDAFSFVPAVVLAWALVVVLTFEAEAGREDKTKYVPSFSHSSLHFFRSSAPILGISIHSIFFLPFSVSVVLAEAVAVVGAVEVDVEVVVAPNVDVDVDPVIAADPVVDPSPAAAPAVVPPPAAPEAAANAAAAASSAFFAAMRFLYSPSGSKCGVGAYGL